MATPAGRRWLRRVCFAAALMAAAVTPGQAARPPAAAGSARDTSPRPCHQASCRPAGSVRWSRMLPGHWVTGSGLAGTTPASGPAFAALGGQVAAVGTGLTVSAYAVRSGRRLWADDLTGFPAGSAIISVRAWPGVVTVGVALPSVAGAGRRARAGRAVPREEVILGGPTGQRLGTHPAALLGGAVAAGPGDTVIVGVHSVTSYDNHTGRVRWSRPTGSAPQPWQVDGGQLYVTVAATGYLGPAPVTALRRIDLRTGAQRLVRPPGPSFPGTLRLAFGGVVLFATASGVTAYSGTTGAPRWHRDGAQPDMADATARRIYLISGNELLGVDPGTGAVRARVAGAAAAASSGLYAVREGTVLGLDHGPLGKAWGYDVATRRVVWTSRPLPWPHFFVDLSGTGGSAPTGQDAALLASCAQPGQPLPGGTGQLCARPRLVLLNR